MDTFENWYTNILEEVATQPTKSLAGDVDTIINSLGTLVKELTEELDSPELNTLNEIDGEGPSKVWQWIWWMPKARKAQQKVNKIKLNVTDMEAAAEDAKDTDQRAKINAKATIAKEQAEELQSLVDDKYNAKGELVKRALHNEKIIGKIAAIKRATGLEDDPEKVASYKEKLAELQVKYKEDQAAIKELEPSEEEKDAEIEKKKEEERLAKERQDKLNAEAKAAKNKKKEPSNTEGTDDTTPPTDDKNSPAKDDTEGTDDTTPPTDDKNSKEGKLKRLEGLLAKAKESGDEEKIKKVQDLIDKVSAKESWQLDGTTLGMMLESEILKLEMSFTLNESRYQNLNVKDRFSRLL